jgi:hypothetical protein
LIVLIFSKTNAEQVGEKLPSIRTTAIEDGDYNRFLVHVHADILEVATHSVASLGKDDSRSTESFPQGKVSFFSRLAYLHLLVLAHIPYFVPRSPH